MLHALDFVPGKHVVHVRVLCVCVCVHVCVRERVSERARAREGGEYWREGCGGVTDTPMQTQQADEHIRTHTQGQ
jgi:hypothetical protein